MTSPVPSARPHRWGGLRVGIIICVTNRRDRRGEQGLLEIERRRLELRTALLGWLPEGAVGQVTFARGQFLFFGDRTIWWQDEFEAPFFMKSEVC